MSYTIEKNVPPPETRRIQQESKYPFEKMEVGDSFVYSNTEDVKIRNALRYFKKKSPEHVFLTRSIDNDTRRLWLMGKAEK